MSVRGTILDTLATQLATITTANGYNSDVGDVRRKVPNSEELFATKPTLVIIDQAADTIRQQCDGNKVRSDMPITILGILRGATSDTPPTDEISDMVSDLRQLMKSPISLGANVRFVEINDMLPGFTGDNKASIHFQITIDYWYDADSP